MNGIKALAAGIAIASLCSAQTVTIKGKVTDTGTTPVAGAIVTMEKGGQTITTGADGTFTLSGAAAIIPGHNNRSMSHALSVTVRNGLLYVNVKERAVVELVTYDLHGRTIALVKQTMDGGTHSMALPRGNAGICLHKVKSGSSEFVIKSNSMGGASGGAAMSIQEPSLKALEKTPAVAINDVIAVNKTGYLNYRVIVTNSDTSGIEIKMIANAGDVTDIDGNVYQSVKIGTQVWTVQNFRATKYNDGTPIPRVTDTTQWMDLRTPGYCYVNNTTNADTIKKFGALYNWYAMDSVKLGPNGWRVPSEADIITLENYMIANGYNWDSTTVGNGIGKSLAAKADWNTSADLDGAIGLDLTRNNKSGFSAVPCGYRTTSGDFVEMGNSCYFWTVSQSYGTTAIFRSLYYSNNTFNKYGYLYKECGFAVRLVKN